MTVVNFIVCRLHCFYFILSHQHFHVEVIVVEFFDSDSTPTRWKIWLLLLFCWKCWTVFPVWLLLRSWNHKTIVTFTGWNTNCTLAPALVFWQCSTSVPPKNAKLRLHSCSGCWSALLWLFFFSWKKLLYYPWLMVLCRNILLEPSAHIIYARKF